MAKTFDVEVTVPEGCSAGDTFIVTVEAPATVKKPRGMLAGLNLEDMTDEQVKRESINANSVLYKAKQRGAAEETIAANQARVDRVNAEKAKRSIGAKTAKVVAPNMESVMDAEEAAEVDAEEVSEEM